MKIIKIFFFYFVCLYFTGVSSVYCQQVYSSPNPKIHKNFTEDDMWKVRFARAFNIHADRSGAILNVTGDFSQISYNNGVLSWKPKITMNVYVYDHTKVDGKGDLIYAAMADEAGQSVEKPVPELSDPDKGLYSLTGITEDGGDNFYFDKYINSLSSLNIQQRCIWAKIKPPVGFPMECTSDKTAISGYVTKTHPWKEILAYLFTLGYANLDLTEHIWTKRIITGTEPKLSSICNQWIKEHVENSKIIVEVIVNQPVDSNVISFTGIKVPLLGVKQKADMVSSTNANLASAIKYLHEPNYNKIFVAAHRGYFKDVPENSLAAISKAIQQRVEMVEIDVRLTKDKHVILAHDLQLGRLTTIPNRILNNPPTGGWPKLPGTTNPKILVSDLTLREIRPDLYGDFTSEPIYLKKADGSITNETIPTLEEVLRQCKDKIIVDVDKIENFFDLIYKDAQTTGTLNQVVVKGRFGTPQDLKNNCCSNGENNKVNIDWKKFMFTPVYFPDTHPVDENGNRITISQSINSFITADPNTFNCVGVELIYLSDNDPLIPMIQTIKDHNKHVIQFPQYPENSGGVWNPKKFRFNDIDPRGDHRNDWEWVLDPSRRPSMLITDRLEVLLNLLEIKGLRY